MKLGSTAPVPPRPPRKRHRVLWGAVLLCGFAGWSGLVFGAGFGWRDFIRPSLQNLTGQTSMNLVVKSFTGAPRRWLAAHLDDAEVDKIHLDIKFKHMHKIHQKREEALAQNLLVTGADDLVPAEIRLGDRTVKAKVRLKGDLPDHLEGDKWSFRVQTRGDDVLWGMRRFSIQAPRTRGFQAEPLFLETLRWFGVLAPRYFFVDVAVNGKDIGLMAVEEHFDKQLLESQGRREGVILKFDESLFWENVLLNGSHGPFENYHNAPITAFKKGTIRKSEALSQDYELARSLLRGFVEGNLPASDVFDAELLGRFLAACEVWDATHPCRWHNLRLYFNPIDRQLEPVGFDGNLHVTWLGDRLLTQQEPITRDILADPAVAESFVRATRELAGALDGGELLDRLRVLEARHLAVLNREFPFRTAMDFGQVQQRANELRDLTPERLADFERVPRGRDRGYPALVHANVIQGDDGPVLELASTIPVPVTVSSVRVRGGEIDSADGSLPGFPVVLRPTPLGAPLRWHSIRVPPVRGADVWQMEGTAIAEGQDRPQAFIATRSVPAATQPPLPHLTPEDVLELHPFLRPAQRAGWLAIQPGSWNVTRSVILPRGIGIEAGPGTTLRFGSDTVLVARGPVELLGTEEAPIRLEPTDDSTAWPGLLVLGAEKESRWTHVQVRATRGFDHEGWKLTGGITFYESDVSLTHCHISDSRGEDGLNIISARFVLDDVAITETASDAFDGDFAEGTVRGGLFRSVGGDGIDVSGSTVVVEGTRLVEVRDKAVSIGEGSALAAKDLVIENVGTGVVAKDLSKGSIQDSELRDIHHVALMAYVKKPEYGPAELNAERLTVERAAEVAVAQIGSRVTIDGVPVEESPFDANALYQEGYMRKRQ